MSIFRISMCCDSIIAITLVLLSAHLCNSQAKGKGPVFQDNCAKHGQICVTHYNCSNARDLINSKKAIPCGFRDEVLKKDTKICCQSSNIIPVVTSPPTPIIRGPGITSPTTTSRNSAAVALQKCQEYTKYQYVTKWKDPDLPGEKRISYQEQDCLNVETLIAGGVPARSKEYPHMAVIGYGNDFKSVTWDCGGSLISEKFVMSAAHCGKTVASGPPRWVLLGDLTLSSTKDDAKPKIYRIVKIHDHPNYKAPSVYYDISLFELNTTVAINPYVRPACLYTSTADFPAKTKASITGWGRTGTVERVSNALLKATIEVTEHQKCRTTFEINPTKLSRGYDSSNMICAGDTEKGRDTCPGDSGGPLQILIPNVTCMWNIVGVTSFGPGICGNNEEPGVYTKVSHYLDWIQSIVWP
ncbi:serine protease snake-like [Planococcus citri]|uniref:serine protease snake-like n=1 Tax=Planococcus citri TaxID=170843 RepID=UPI0031FA0B0A